MTSARLAIWAFRRAQHRTSIFPSTRYAAILIFAFVFTLASILLQAAFTRPDAADSTSFSLNIWPMEHCPRDVRLASGPGIRPDWVADVAEEVGVELVDVKAANCLFWESSDNADLLQTTLGASPGIEWVQLPWAGVEPELEAGVFDSSRIWTSGKGAYSEPVAEHALMLILAGLRKLPKRVKANLWGDDWEGETLYDKNVVIVGGGGIARAMLDLLKPFRCKTVVVRRDPTRKHQGADLTVGLSELGAVVKSADILIVACALTAETNGIINRDVFAVMKPTAWLINVGRGRHVITNDLVEALDSGQIGGAGLDVVDPEPLGTDSPLWGRDNCIITPHVANSQSTYMNHLPRRLRANLVHFRDGEPLEGIIDIKAGY